MVSDGNAAIHDDGNSDNNACPDSLQISNVAVSETDCLTPNT